MTDLSEFTALTENEELRRLASDLQSKLRQARARNVDLVEAATKGARDAMIAFGPVPPVPAPKRDRRKGGEVALWHLTDWQASKVTTSYNQDVMRERILRFCDKAERITDVQRADHPVDECVILFGGDMGEGLFQFPAQPFEIDSTIFVQYVSAARLMVDVVRRALAHHRTVKVVSEWGNHGRIGGKRATVPRSDNFDRMAYELSRALLSDEPRVTWHDCPEDVQHVEIGNYRALLIHGDEIGRNGYASPMTVVSHVTRWQSGAHDWKFRDCYMGHYHTHAEWPLPNGGGSVYQTGSPESDNRYAGVMLAAASTPSQRLHFIDPEKGRVTAAYKVWLDD